MQKLFDFVNKYGYVILLLLLLITLQHGCYVNKKFRSLHEHMDVMQHNNDSLLNKMSNDMIHLIRLEGLETELRFIEATDRKLMDVNRQSKIREEIKKMGVLVPFNMKPAK